MNLNWLRYYRKIKGGSWVKTEKRGWITEEAHQLYLTYKFDPIAIQYEAHIKIQKNGKS